MSKSTSSQPKTAKKSQSSKSSNRVILTAEQAKCLSSGEGLFLEDATGNVIAFTSAEKRKSAGYPEDALAEIDGQLEFLHYAFSTNDSVFLNGKARIGALVVLEQIIARVDTLRAH